MSFFSFLPMVMLLTGFIVSPLALGQDSTQQDNQFVGIVQFLKGEASWTRRPQRSNKEPIQFKTFFHLGDIVSTKDDGHLKLISSSRCIGVVYNSAEVAAPTKTTTPIWKTNAKSLRWICPKGAHENLIADTHQLQVQGGEILFKDDQLFVVSGRVLSRSGALESNKSYRWKNEKWVEYKNWNDDAYDLWKLQTSLPQPNESKKLDEPQKPVASRWILGPIGGGGHLEHGNEKVTDDYNFEGGRITGNFLWGDRSILMSLTFLGIDSTEDTEPSYSGPQPGEHFNYTRSDVIVFEVGQRLFHEKSWSPYYKLGLAYEKLEIDLFGSVDSMNSYYTRRIYEFIDASAALGIDKMFLTETLGWGGIYLSAEAFYQISVLEVGETIQEDQSNDSTQSELSNLSSNFQRAGIIFHAGFVLIF